jgi:hypothetical protein
MQILPDLRFSSSPVPIEKVEGQVVFTNDFQANTDVEIPDPRL